MPLLDPAMCVVLCLNPRPGSFLEVIGSESDSISHRQRLVHAAVVAATVPFYIATREHRDSQSYRLPAALPASRLRNYSPASLRRLWADGGLCRDIAAHKRSSLVLVGSWLETDVTFLALSALADGFDVHVVVDASPSRAVDIRQPAIDRIVQAGGVPLSSSQMAGEWAERTQSDSHRNALLELVASEYPAGLPRA